MVAFLTSLVITVGITVAVMLYGRRRPVGTPISVRPGRSGPSTSFASTTVSAREAMTADSTLSSGSGSKHTPGPYSAAARQRAAHAP